MQLTKEQKEFLDRVVGGGRKNWTLNSEGKVDVDGWVSIHNGDLTEIPVKFGRVTEFFSCSYNKLTSLENCPDYVGGDFSCSINHLTSLEFAPSEVGGEFSCYNNPLKNYFKNIKEEDFKLWGNLNWWITIHQYPRLITIAKNYVSKKTFINLIKQYPKTKLYLK